MDLASRVHLALSRPAAEEIRPRLDRERVEPVLEERELASHASLPTSRMAASRGSVAEGVSRLQRNTRLSSSWPSLKTSAIT